MLEDLLMPRFAEAAKGLPPHLTYYQETEGSTRARSALATFLSEHVNQNQYAFDPKHMLVGAGCNAMLELLFFCITEPADAVLIPRPYYAAFEFDLQCKSGAKVFGVRGGGSSSGADVQADGFIDPVAYYPTQETLDEAFEDAKRAGFSPSVLLACQPNNPLGTARPDAQLIL